jgi:hypothetical protein
VSDDGKTVEQRFQEFHERNPRVYDLLRGLCREARAKGHRHIGIDLLFARYRWERPSVSMPGEEFKISNDFKPYYARLLMVRHPEFSGLFRLKRLSVPEPRWAAGLWDEDPEPRERRRDREGAPLPGQTALPVGA